MCLSFDSWCEQRRRTGCAVSRRALCHRRGRRAPPGRKRARAPHTPAQKRRDSPIENKTSTDSRGEAQRRRKRSKSPTTWPSARSPRRSVERSRSREGKRRRRASSVVTSERAGGNGGGRREEAAAGQCKPGSRQPRRRGRSTGGRAASQKPRGEREREREREKQGSDNQT